MNVLTYSMKIGFLLTLLATILIGLGGCSSLGPRPSITLEEIVAMSNKGQSDEAIIDRIRESRTAFSLSASQIIELNDKGVSPSVLDYLQQRFVESERREERLRYVDPLWIYPCFGCSYPHRHIVPFYVYPY